MFNKSFSSKSFYGWKLISLITCMHVKFSSNNFWWIKYFCLQNHFLKNRYIPKLFHNFFCRNYLWFQNHFLENRFLPKIFNNILSVKYLYGCKIISSKTGNYQKFWTNFFAENMFRVAKSFPRKQVTTKNFQHNFFVENF